MVEKAENNNLVIITENGKEYAFDFSKTQYASTADEDLLVAKVEQVLNDLISVNQEQIKNEGTKVTREDILKENEPDLIVSLVDQKIFRTAKVMRQDLEAFEKDAEH